MRKVALIAKGNSNKAKKFFQNLSINENFKNINFEIAFTQKARDAYFLSEKFANLKYDYVIACGGDGTSFEVLNGILKSDYPLTGFGILPIGSANDFARAQKLSKSFNNLCLSIENEKIKSIDVGKIELQKNGELWYFLNVCDVGFGPEVVKKVNSKRHILPPDLSFLWAITKTLFSYKAKSISIEINNKTLAGKTLVGAFANSSCFGGGIYIAPDAKIDDGQLNFTRIGDVSMLDYLLQIGKLKKKQFVKHPEISYQKTKSVRLNSNEKVGIEADGEYVGELPCTVKIKPKLLKFLDTST